MNGERELRVYYQDENGDTIEYVPESDENRSVSLSFNCDMSANLCTTINNDLTETLHLEHFLDNYIVLYLETPWSYPVTVYQYRP